MLQKDERGHKFITVNNHKVLVNDTPPTSQPASMLGSKGFEPFGLDKLELRQREREMEATYIREQVEGTLDTVGRFLTGFCTLICASVKTVLRLMWNLAYFFSGFWILKIVLNLLKLK